MKHETVLWYLNKHVSQVSLKLNLPRAYEFLIVECSDLVVWLPLYQEHVYRILSMFTTCVKWIDSWIIAECEICYYLFS